jgi:hypothetical protein
MGTTQRLGVWVAALCLALVLTSGTVHAQEPLAEDDVFGAPPEPEAEPAPEPAPPPPPPPAPPAEEPEPEPESDHAAMVGRAGVGFLGIASVPVGANGAFGTVQAPVLGVRRWFTERAGLDLGIGFGVAFSSGRDVPDFGDSVPHSRTTSTAVTAHIGLPIALFHQRHYAFLFIPEVDIGAGFGAMNLDPDIPDTTNKHIGVLVQPALRLGAEVHFGFMGIPHLSLQASVGVRARYTMGQSKDFSDDMTRTHNVTVGTTVQNSPWNIFISNIAAIYYF